MNKDNNTDFVISFFGHVILMAEGRRPDRVM